MVGGSSLEITSAGRARGTIKLKSYNLSVKLSRNYLRGQNPRNNVRLVQFQEEAGTVSKLPPRAEPAEQRRENHRYFSSKCLEITSAGRTRGTTNPIELNNEEIKSRNYLRGQNPRNITVENLQMLDGRVSKLPPRAEPAEQT